MNLDISGPSVFLLFFCLAKVQAPQALWSLPWMPQMSAGVTCCFLPFLSLCTVARRGRPGGNCTTACGYWPRCESNYCLQRTDHANCWLGMDRAVCSRSCNLMPRAGLWCAIPQPNGANAVPRCCALRTIDGRHVVWNFPAPPSGGGK